MNNPFHKQPHKRSRAQTMVEFALALPVLLMLVYGTLETGRLLFIFASTVTAARQAVRYGSATGDNASGIPYYQDCDGIQKAAESVGFINVFTDINITYDGGLDAGGNPQAISGLPIDQQCQVTDFSDPSIDVGNGDRINVHVETLWEPIAPLVPFEPFPIQADSSRTILESIAIQVTAPVGPLPGSGTGTIMLEISHSNDPYDAAGDVIPFTFTISNTDPVNPATGPFTIWRTGGRALTIDDPCGALIILDPQGGANDSTTCNGSYTVIQDDLDNGYFDFTGFALGTAVGSNEETEVVNATQLAELTLTKSANPDATAIVGTVVNYTFYLQNTGNVRLYSPFTVNDDQTGDADCTVADNTSPLDPGETTTCVDSYIIKQQDLQPPYTLINHAIATGRFQPQTITSNEATFTVYIPPMLLRLVVTPLTVNQAGQTIRYDYYLSNNTDSNSFLDAPYSIIDSRYSVTCPQSPSPMPVGGVIQCTYIYTVTQADMDAGPAITNTAKGQFEWKNKTQETFELTATVAVVQSPALSLQKTAVPPHDPPLNAGEVVTYNYLLRNTGNVTLTQPFTINDDKLTGITCTDPLLPLAPNATKTCTKQYTLTQADKANGSLTNHATATAKFNSQTITSALQTYILLIHNAPRVELVKTANFTGVLGSGQVITYTYTIHNTGITNLSNLGVTDKVVPSSPVRNIAVDCSMAKNQIAPGESTTCRGTYTTVQADVSLGSVTNEALATALSDPNQILSNTASVTVQVWHQPNAIDDSVNTGVGIPVTTSVLTNDDLGRTPTSIILFSQGVNGTVSCTATQCTYTPNPPFTGTDTYSYTIKDANNNTDTATVTVTVWSLPNAVDDNDTTSVGNPVTTSVLANDSLGRQPTTIISNTNGTNGSVSCTATQCTYTPNPLFTGTDTYSYTIRDANNNSDTATVTVSISSLLNAVDDNDSTFIGLPVTTSVLTNDALGTQPTTITSFTQGSNGSVNCSATQCTYSPLPVFMGVDSYTYTITDASNNTDTATVTISVP